MDAKVQCYPDFSTRSLEHFVDDLLQRYCSPFSPRHIKRFLTQLCACGSHCLLITGAVNRVHEHTKGLTQRFCCSPHSCCFHRLSLSCLHRSQALQTGSDQLFVIVGRQKRQALLVEATCGCNVALQRRQACQEDTRLDRVSSL